MPQIFEVLVSSSHRKSIRRDDTDEVQSHDERNLFLRLKRNEIEGENIYLRTSLNQIPH